MKAISLHNRFDITPEGCWQWTGITNDVGYGYMQVDGRRMYVHRVSYMLFVGPIPARYQIDHLCRNTRCLNPEHLEAVTSRENSMRGNHPLFVTARTGVCRRGHDLTDPANVRESADGRRRCRVCARETLRAWRDARRATCSL